MVFAGINLLAVIVAAVAAYAFGAVYYMILARPWMRAAGLTEAQVRSGSALPFVLAAIAALVIAYVLAGTIGHMGEVTIRIGVISALFIWAGFILTTVSVNNAYQLKPWLLTIIDAGHWLGALLIQGAIIGAFGV